MTKLDELISGNAKPSFILDFVGAAADIRRLFSESLFFQRIFQLDFFLSCGRPDIDRMFKFAEFLPARDKSLFALQVLLAESDKAQYAKYKYRRMLRDMSSAFGSFNPYVYLHGDTADRVRAIDKACFKAAISGNMLRLHEAMPAEAFDFLVSHMGYSLFQNRLAQFDFLSAIPQPERVKLVKSAVCNLMPNYYIRFAKSILASNLEFRLKTATLDAIKAAKLRFCNKKGRWYADLVSEYSSFQELVLKDCVSGGEDFGEMFAMHLLLYMPENLRTWLYSSQRLPSYLRLEDIDDLIRYSVSNGNAHGSK